jgi:hypothetical protein
VSIHTTYSCSIRAPSPPTPSAPQLRHFPAQYHYAPYFIIAVSWLFKNSGKAGAVRRSPSKRALKQPYGPVLDSKDAQPARVTHLRRLSDTAKPGAYTALRAPSLFLDERFTPQDCLITTCPHLLGRQKFTFALAPDPSQATSLNPSSDRPLTVSGAICQSAHLRSDHASST